MQNPSRTWTSHAGFTMLEALVAIFVTLIVMATVFGFLATGARTSTVEMDRADLQAQTREALNQISRDVMLAGYGLPPEFPSFGTESPAVSSSRKPGTERIEIVGAGDVLGTEPLGVDSFDGRTAHLSSLPPPLDLGQPVLLYDDLPVNGSWVFGLVSGVRSAPDYAIEIETKPGGSVAAPNGTITLPPDVFRYNRVVDGPPASGFLTPVSVVAYEVHNSGDDGMSVLMRRLNWGDPLQVANLERMEIRYFVGGTMASPIIRGTPRPRRILSPRDTQVPPPEPGEIELREPPHPQPDPSAAIVDGSVVRAVRITLTGRSRQANLVGSALSNEDEGAFVRQTLSTRVATRNLLSRAEHRQLDAANDDNADNRDNRDNRDDNSARGKKNR